MDIRTEPQPPDLTLLLPRHTYYQLLHTLRGLLPPPATDTPEDRARRDNAAVAHVASLIPVNADEANLAAQHVAAHAYAMDCLRLAGQFRGDPSFFLKCNAQAASMMREARASRTLLMRVQAERRKLEADSTAADRAAWTEHCAIGLMTDALADPPRASQPAEPAPAPAADVEQSPQTPRTTPSVRPHLTGSPQLPPLPLPQADDHVGTADAL